MRFNLTLAIERFACAVRGHDDRRVHEPGRVSLKCATCGRQTPGWGPSVPGWGEGIKAPKTLHSGALGFKELCQARKHKIEPAVLPRWAAPKAREA